MREKECWDKESDKRVRFPECEHVSEPGLVRMCLTSGQNMGLSLTADTIIPHRDP